MARSLQSDFASGGRPPDAKVEVFMGRFASINRFAVLSLLIFANLNFSYGQPDSIYRLPAGTRIKLKLDAEINSRVSSVNDTFLAAVTQPVKVRDSVMLPTGTIVEGRVLSIKSAGPGQAGTMAVGFETLKISGETRRIDGMMITPVTAESSGAFRFLSVIGGAALGAAIGAASKAENGVLIGAAIGAGAGTGLALLKKGKDVRIKKDQEFEIELKKEVVLPVLDY